ncbi:hypothetical protein A3Q56_01138 [Intoshia linei]|uniref:Tectonic-1-3 N-terminal domain-containing protein n=1 Tax=Intoshia linei TaxID=1819745 RepID=A0A177BBT4_9BILA|nr:hypothetical protein A3Q56_01138 [Intoshia linei]
MMESLIYHMFGLKDKLILLLFIFSLILVLGPPYISVCNDMIYIDKKEFEFNVFIRDLAIKSPVTIKCEHLLNRYSTLIFKESVIKVGEKSVKMTGTVFTLYKKKFNEFEVFCVANSDSKQYQPHFSKSKIFKIIYKLPEIYVKLNVDKVLTGNSLMVYSYLSNPVESDQQIICCVSSTVNDKPIISKINKCIPKDTITSIDKGPNLENNLYFPRNFDLIIKRNKIYNYQHVSRSSSNTSIYEKLYISCKIKSSQFIKNFNFTLDVFSGRYTPINWSNATDPVNKLKPVIKLYFDQTKNIKSCKCDLLKNVCELKCCCDKDCELYNNGTDCINFEILENNIDFAVYNPLPNIFNFLYDNNPLISHFYNKFNVVRSEQNYFDVLNNLVKVPSFRLKKSKFDENILSIGYKDKDFLLNTLSSSSSIFQGILKLFPILSKFGTNTNECVSDRINHDYNRKIYFLRDESYKCHFTQNDCKPFTFLDVGTYYDIDIRDKLKFSKQCPISPRILSKNDDWYSSITTVIYYVQRDYDSIPVKCNSLEDCFSNRLLENYPLFDNKTSVCLNALTKVDMEIIWSNSFVDEIIFTYYITRNTYFSKTYNHVYSYQYIPFPTDSYYNYNFTYLNNKTVETTQKFNNYLSFNIKFINTNSNTKNLSKLSGNPWYQWNNNLIFGKKEIIVGSNDTQVNMNQKIFNVLKNDDGFCKIENNSNKNIKFGINQLRHCKIEILKNEFNHCASLRKSIYDYYNSGAVANVISKTGYISNFTGFQNYTNTEWIFINKYQIIKNKITLNFNKLKCTNVPLFVSFIVLYQTMPPGINSIGDYIPSMYKISSASLVFYETSIFAKCDDVNCHSESNMYNLYYEIKFVNINKNMISKYNKTR